jgi:hypothetical protein
MRRKGKGDVAVSARIPNCSLQGGDDGRDAFGHVYANVYGSL